MNRVKFNNTDAQAKASLSPSSESGYVLLTGATGLVGQYLLKDLFLRHKKLAVLVRPTRKLCPTQRIEKIMQRWESQLGQSLPRPVVLEGNLDDSDLGLSDENKKWVSENCTQIIHNAAVLKFEGSNLDGEPWKTNFAGTKHVVEFAADCEIKNFHYVSTAYVSGICDNVYKESDFDRGQEFRNEYERSKFEAEKIVRNSNHFESITIFRPAVIVGDSRTGYTPSYHGLHVYLRLMATLIPHQKPDENGIRHTPIQLDVDADQPRNLVPVDWVANVISEVVCREEAFGKTYHLVPDHGPTHRELLDHCYEYFNTEGVHFSDSPCESSSYNDNDFAQQFLSNVSVYSAYDKSDPDFDKQNVRTLGLDFECPVIDKAAIFRFIDFGTSDNWGKQKVVQPNFENWIGENIESIELAAKAESFSASFGLNVLGPGGGQWTVSADAESKIGLVRGLPCDPELYVVTIDQSVNKSLLNGQTGKFWRNLLSQAIVDDDSTLNTLPSAN